MMGERWQKRAVTGLVAATLGLQVVAGLRLLCLPGGPRLACSPRLWPFVDYPMFSELRVPGERVTAWLVYGRTAGGANLVLDPLEDDAPPLARELVAGMLARSDARIRAWVNRYETVHAEALDALRLEATELLFTDTGFVQDSVQTACSWSRAEGVE